MIQVADVGIGISGQEGMQVRERQSFSCCSFNRHRMAALLKSLEEIKHFSIPWLHSTGCDVQWLCHIQIQTPQEAAAGSRPLVLPPPCKHDPVLHLQKCGKTCSPAMWKVASFLFKLALSSACFLPNYDTLSLAFKNVFWKGFVDKTPNAVSLCLCADVRESAVLVSVLLRVLWERHDQLLGAHPLQSGFHLSSSPHLRHPRPRHACRHSDEAPWALRSWRDHKGDPMHVRDRENRNRQF